MQSTYTAVNVWFSPPHSPPPPLVPEHMHILEHILTYTHSPVGGEDFDKRLVAYAAKEFETKTGIKLGKADKGALAVRLV
jgi:hypothetical protein